MAAIAAPPAASARDIDLRRLAAFLAMVFGMFMALLDIQIVSASLSEIQAGLSASADEISWVQTAYLIAEVVMIPLSGFLARVLSTRVLFALSAAGFTLASIACATATSINEMIVYRAIQGFVGGGMIPAVFAAAFTIFPPARRAMVAPLIGLVATLAPTIGPTVGGYLSNTFSWHWLFLVNVGPGVLVSLAAWTLIDFDEPDHGLMRHFDWIGLAAMAAFLGSLEYVLEEGPGNDWLQDRAVLVMSLVTLVGGTVFFARTLTRAEPIVDLRAFRNVNFALGSMFSFVLGIGLYGLTYLYPLYLANIRGYDSLMIGEALFVSGLAMFCTAPISGILSTKLDPRAMMMVGFLGFAAGTWQVSGLTADWDFYELLLPQVLRGVSLMLCMVPINNLALGTLPPAQIKNASGLFNLMRNLGGAVGLAVINTILTDRNALHVERLSESVHWGNPAAEDRLATLAATFAGHGIDGTTAALAQVTRAVHRQAMLLSLTDVFVLLTALFAGLAVCTLLMRKPPAATARPGGGH